MQRALRAAVVAVVVGATSGAAAWTFPDSHDEVPRNWQGPVFRLSQDYPPRSATAAYPWQQVDFRAQPAAYLKRVWDYILEGNREVDWVVQNNAVRKWYHAPWMHYGANGREFLRGMTRERTTPRPSQPGQGELGPGQMSCFQNWAVSFFNEPGGATVAQVWADPFAPDAVKALFPEGTLAAKLLFTAASVDQVPYLAGTLEWDANVDDIPATDNSCRQSNGRKVQKMRLLQVDIAVRDRRSDDSIGWVFGTFSYDGNRPGEGWWDKMVPVGLMWGNDPELTPQSHQQGARVKESWINPDLRTPNHLGWLGRLNGPVDNPASACTSCHGTAQVPVRSPMIPRQNDPDIMRWFRNVRAGDSFDQRAISTDYSLQISMGIQNFMLWKQAQGGFIAPPPAAAPSPGSPPPSAAFSPAATAQDTIIVNNEVVYRVSRD